MKTPHAIDSQAFTVAVAGRFAGREQVAALTNAERVAHDLARFDFIQELDVLPAGGRGFETAWSWLESDVPRPGSGDRVFFKGEPLTENFVAAVHEAAHAVTAFALGGFVSRVSLDWKFGGNVRAQLPGRRNDPVGAVFQLAGIEAERRFTGRTPLRERVEGDVREATRLTPAVRLREQQRARAAKLLDRDWPAVLAVAAELHQRRAFSGSVVREVIERTRVYVRRSNRS
jgi:hypothetical protein